MAFEDRYNRAQYPVTLGAPVVFNLNSGNSIVTGRIVVTGVLTISGATVAGTKIGDNALVNIVRRVLVVANKAGGSRYYNGALVSSSPQSLLRFAMTQERGKYIDDLFGQTLAGDAYHNGVFNVYLSIPIYFGLKNALGGYTTALNMNAVDSTGAPVYSAVQVRVEFAQLVTELFSGNNGAMAFAGMCEWEDDRLALQTDTLPVVQEDHELYIQNANWRLIDPSLPNNGAFTQIQILAQQGTPGWALSDNLINEIKMQGGTINLKQYWQDIRARMISDGFYDLGQTLTGIYFFDFTHGLLANANPAAGLAHELSVNNPSGASDDRLRIYTRRVFQLR